MNWRTLVADPWVVGIGGSLVAAGIAWFLARLFGTREVKRSPVTAQQNASPMLTQTFNPTINFHPIVAVPALDTLSSEKGKETEGHGHKKTIHLFSEGQLGDALTSFKGTGGQPTLVPEDGRQWKILGAEQVPPLDARTSDVLRRRQFFAWLPIVAMAKDLDGNTIVSNDELRRLVGRPNVAWKEENYWGEPTAALVRAHDDFVRKENKTILCVERIPVGHILKQRLSIRFPLRHNGSPARTGAFGFDLEDLRDAEVLMERECGRRPCRFKAFESERQLTYSSEYSENDVDDILGELLHWMPGVAAAKDPKGRLLSITHGFQQLTGKRISDVIGRLANEIWRESPETGDLITAHDQLVRETKAAFLSAVTLKVQTELSGQYQTRERLNLRFPILRIDELEMTGVLGFDYRFIKDLVDELSKPSPRGTDRMFVCEPDQPGTWEPIERAVETWASAF